jgi:hypothetical protein
MKLKARRCAFYFLGVVTAAKIFFFNSFNTHIKTKGLYPNLDKALFLK